MRPFDAPARQPLPGAPDGAWRLPRRSLWVGLCILAAGSPLGGQTAPAAPCSAPEYRAFDFWVGEWDVYGPGGDQVGQNVIRTTMNGCVLHESYDGGQGYHGESFNVWDASRGAWHQSWVDNGGALLLLEGEATDGGMVLQGSTLRADGTAVLNRITWVRLDASGDRVRQHWEASTDGGDNWSTVFDGEYRRRPPSQR